MSYRLVADENVELATITYLRKLGHDVERIGEIPDLDFGSSDEEIAAYAETTERLVLTQDGRFRHGRSAISSTNSPDTSISPKSRSNT